MVHHTHPQEILADAVDRLCPPEKAGSIIRNSANVVSFEEDKDPVTGEGWAGGGGSLGLCGGVLFDVASRQGGLLPFNGDM